MVACTAQIIAENKAKEGGRPHEPRGKAQEKDSLSKADMRRQLADANYQLQHLLENNNKLKLASDTEGPPYAYGRGFHRQEWSKRWRTYSAATPAAPSGK